MGFLNVMMNYGKARLARRVLGRTLGGGFGTAMMMAWLGKKAYNHYQSRRAKTAVTRY